MKFHPLIKRKRSKSAAKSKLLANSTNLIGMFAIYMAIVNH